MLVYLTIFLFAILEGEIYYIAMCVAASAGKLRWEGVLIAGALGGRRAINSGSTCCAGTSTGSIATRGSPGVATPSSIASTRIRR